MLMFILGAISLYLISSIVAIILEELDIVDIWTFAEIYFSIVVLPFAGICILIRKIRKKYKKVLDK